jgi:hypothetical protein
MWQAKKLLKCCFLKQKRFPLIAIPSFNKRAHLESPIESVDRCAGSDEEAISFFPSKAEVRPDLGQLNVANQHAH